LNEVGRRSLRSKSSTGSARRILSVAASNASISSQNTIREEQRAPPVQLPPHNAAPSPFNIDDDVEEGTLRYSGGARHDATLVSDVYPEQGASEDVGDALTDATMLDSVVLPAIVSLFPRVSTVEARSALTNLQRAFQDAERIIPGLCNELVNEIVDSVEHVDGE